MAGENDQGNVNDPPPLGAGRADPPPAGAGNVGVPLPMDPQRLAGLTATFGRAATRAYLVGMGMDQGRIEEFMNGIQPNADAILNEAQRLANERRAQEQDAPPLGAVPRRAGLPAGGEHGDHVDVAAGAGAGAGVRQGYEGYDYDDPHGNQHGRSQRAFHQELVEHLDQTGRRARPQGGEPLHDGAAHGGGDQDQEDFVLTNGVESAIGYIFNQFQNLGLGDERFDNIRNSFSNANLSRMLSRMKREELSSVEEKTSYEIVTCPNILPENLPNNAGHLTSFMRKDFMRSINNVRFSAEPGSLTTQEYLEELKHFCNRTLNGSSIYALMKASTSGRPHSFIQMQEQMGVDLAHAWSLFNRLFAQSFSSSDAKLQILQLKSQKPTNIREYCLKLYELTKEASYSVGQHMRKSFVVTSFRSDLGEVLDLWFPFQTNEIKRREALGRTAWVTERRRLKAEGLNPNDFPSSFDPLASYLTLVVDTLENVRPLDSPQTTTLPRHVTSAAYKPRKLAGLATIGFDADQLEAEILQEQADSSSALLPSTPTPTPEQIPSQDGGQGLGEVAANYSGGGFQKDKDSGMKQSSGDMTDRRKLDINDSRWRQCIFCGNKNTKEGEIRHDFRYCKYFPAPAMPSATACPSCGLFHPTNKPCAPSNSA